MNSKFPEMGLTIFSAMSALASEHGAINLAQGFPEFDCSNQIKKLVNEAMNSGANQYAPMPGLKALRNAIADKVKFCYDVDYCPETEITVTAGATQGIFTSIAALVNTGDEVIYFEPAYDCYSPAIRLFGGIPVPVSMDFPDYTYNWEAVRNSITLKTRLIIINSPNNPCGKTISQSDINQLAQIVKEFSLYVISDEVYEHIVFDGLKHLSIGTHPELKSKTITVSSFGKTYHNTGWKLGYVLGPAEIITEFRKVHQYLVFSVHHPSQKAFAELLSYRDFYVSLSPFYEQKRNFFLSAIAGSSWKALKTEGTYFQLLIIPEEIQGTDVEIANWMTTKFKLASIPVSAFYSDATDNRVLRFCFAKNEETLIKAAEILHKI
jgi:methionine aminotransferase